SNERINRTLTIRIGNLLSGAGEFAARARARGQAALESLSATPAGMPGFCSDRAAVRRWQRGVAWHSDECRIGSGNTTTRVPPRRREMRTPALPVLLAFPP